MKIAYNPLGSGALPKAPDNKDITFDLVGKVIYALGVPFDGKDTKYTVFKKHISSDNTGGSEGLVPIPSYSTTNNRLLREDGLWVTIAGVTPPDAELSTESTNAVQNKIITNKINEILASIQLKAADVYKNVKVGNTTLVASGVNDTLEFKLGNGITITPNATNKTLEFSINATGNLGINTSYNNKQLVVKILDEYYNKWNAVYDWYISITQEDTDNLINKWLEIVDFLNSIAEGTNILDEFVTRKTDLTIIGGKTFSKQIISSVAQGTAPFSVTSTTVVSKLNADLLDGYNASDLFTNLSNDTNLLSVTIGGTNKKLTIDYANAAGRLEGGSIATWGTLTSSNGYTNVATYDYGSTKGAFSFAGKGGQLSLQLDGFFYLNEGRFLVLDTNNYSTYLDNRYYTETEINNKLKEYLQLIGGIMTGSIILKGNTSADMTYSGNVHPALCFENSDSSQNIRLIFTDYDSYRSPAGLKLVGNQGGEWLEVAGITYGPGFYHTSYGSANYLLTSNGGAWAVHTGRNNEANKIVRTDANGYIQAGWINTTSGDMGTTDINKIYCSNDGYIRYKTPADFFNILANDGNQISITVGSQNRKLTVNYATTSGKVIINLHTSNNTEYPIVWTNSNNTTNAVAADLFKSYSHLTYNPSARRIISGQYLANNAAGPHFVAQSTEGNWSYVRLHNGSTYWDIATRSDSGSGGLWLARLKGADNGIFVSTGNNIGISTSNPADKLDAYGIIRSTANSRYLRIGPQNSSHTHYETNADISHWFNKRVDVNGAIWRYNTNYGIDSDGSFYAKVVYANRDGSSTGGGVSLYSNSDPMTYGIAFRGTGTYGTHGGVSGDWATYLTMSDTTNRGWIFRRGSSNVFSISGTGYISSNNSGYFAGNLSSANSGASSPGDAALEVREYARAGTNTSTAPHTLMYAPRIGFHWGNRYWANLIYFDSAFRFMNNSGSSYVNVVASTFYGNLSGIASQVTVSNSDSNSTYRMVWHSGNTLYGTGGIYCNPASDYLYAGSFYTGNWFRSSGATGWYNESYGGGIYMEDSTWVRLYNNKKFYVNNSEASAIHSAGGVYVAGAVHSYANYLKSTCNGKTITIGSLNASYCHYSTDAPSHWFNKPVYVQGHVYGGSSYNRRLAYVDELPTNTWRPIHWAVYLIFHGTASNVSFSKKAGNHNFFTSGSTTFYRETQQTIVATISYPSGWDENTTMIFGNGAVSNTSDYYKPCILTIQKEYGGTDSRVRFIMSDDSTVENRACYAWVYFLCIG